MELMVVKFLLVFQEKNGYKEKNCQRVFQLKLVSCQLWNISWRRLIKLMLSVVIAVLETTFLVMVMHSKCKF